MTLLEIRKKLARYLQRSLEEFAADGQDLLIEALENARLNAEKTYNWEPQQTSLVVVVQPTGTSLDTSIKAVTGAWIMLGDEPYPLSVRKQADIFVRQSKLRRANNGSRYLSDADSVTPGLTRSQYQLVFHGKLATLVPAQTTPKTITLDIQEWMDTYRGKADSYTDWMLTQGSDYLFWQSINELNFLTKNFIPRQEGNMAPPERQAAEALLKLHDYDAHSFSRAIYYK